MKEETTEDINNCNTCKDRCGKMDVYDWLANLPELPHNTDIVEVQFKNTRKVYFRNSTQVRLQKGDIVAVEASPGHDIGVVSLTGELVLSHSV